MVSATNARDGGTPRSLLNRLMFIYFLQKKPPGFSTAETVHYLRDKLEESKDEARTASTHEFLQALFFEGFAKPEGNGRRGEDAARPINYLNGGLFLPHQIEQQNHEDSRSRSGL